MSHNAENEDDAVEHKRVWTNNELEDLVRQLSLALEATQLGIWQHNIAKNQTRWDEQLQRIYGVEKGLLDVVWLESVHPDDLVAAQAIFEQAVDSRCDYASEFRIVTPEGYVRHIRSRAKFFIDVNSDPCFIGAEWDVTEDVLRATQLAREHEAAERSRAEARHAADHDYLTGLRNRRAFDRLLDEDLGNNVTEMALAHIDIDHFKEINDRFGHAGGDKVLKHVAHIIRSVVSHDEVGVRLGGDEFAVLVKQGAERLHTVVTAIRAALAFPVEIDATSVQIECSIGLTTAPKSDANTLLSYSDIALYEAKRSGRNRDTLFSPEMAAKAAASRSMLETIRRGIENSDFLPYYQVQVDAKSGQVVGLEALARWASPGGLRTPVDFLELAAMNGLLEKLDDMILRKVLSDLAQWTLADLDPPRVSVNLSAARLEDPTLPQKLARLSIPKGRVSFELIETIFLDKLSNQAKANIAAIRDLGIGIEIDDLGSGHASLLGLLELKPDRVKLDKLLVIPAGHNVAPRTLVSSLVQIARALGIEVVAEGVETEQLADTMAKLGVDILQGYAFGQPQPAQEIVSHFRSRDPHRRSACAIMQP
jgi:diguanylate cyclase (GGDEF)-like protein